MGEAGYLATGTIRTPSATSGADTPTMVIRFSTSSRP